MFTLTDFTLMFLLGVLLLAAWMLGRTIKTLYDELKAKS